MCESIIVSFKLKNIFTEFSFNHLSKSGFLLFFHSSGWHIQIQMLIYSSRTIFPFFMTFIANV